LDGELEDQITDILYRPTRGYRHPVPATDDRVPHISLVFREMWDTTVLHA
jgi:hypothetical protein